MALSGRFIPQLLGPQYWSYDYPDDLFGMRRLSDDLFHYRRPQQTLLYSRPSQQNKSSGTSIVKNDSNSFQVNLNVKHFKPEELEIKAVDNSIVIHGKHEEQADEHGYIKREFTRRYLLPDGVEADKVVSRLGRDGVLTIEAPKKPAEPIGNERVVPILMDHQNSVTTEPN